MKYVLFSFRDSLLWPELFQRKMLSPLESMNCPTSKDTKHPGIQHGPGEEPGTKGKAESNESTSFTPLVNCSVTPKLDL